MGTRLVKLLLERDDIDVSLVDKTLLSWAVENGYERVVRLLRARNAIGCAPMV